MATVRILFVLLSSALHVRSGAAQVALFLGSVKLFDVGVAPDADRSNLA